MVFEFIFGKTNKRSKELEQLEALKKEIDELNSLFDKALERLGAEAL